ncbi:hypothetical protein CYMTET_35747 [Cymbomonas tetramitiformis]|uniref:Ceramidase n=1 Tax=Cymbomonas tetramitiformis TaxID=36881 RepID=A0AAE0F8K7_9CHLO|nr:hypothetical protein CYMTET_35747 [Cymbomonas tetramitiformis]
MPDNCFCELPREGLIRQPSDSSSNLFFGVVGFVILGLYSGKQFASNFTLTAAMSGLGCLFICSGSAYYHASLTFTGQFLDNIGMFLVLIPFFIYTLQKLNLLDKDHFWQLYTPILAVVIVVELYVPSIRRYIFGLFIVVLLGFEFYRIHKTPGTDKTYLITGLVVFLMAYAVWYLDLDKIICDPKSWMQGHAIWHALSATAVFLVYKHYELSATEDKENEEAPHSFEPLKAVA